MRAGGEARIRTADSLDAAILDRIRELPGASDVGQSGDVLTLRVADDDVLSDAVALMATAGARIREVTSGGPGLEELYLSIVRETEEPSDA